MVQIKIIDDNVIGRSSFELFQEIVSSCESIEEIQIVPYSYTPLIQERTSLTKEDNITFDDAITLKETTGLPFWDACMLALISNDNKASESFIREVMFHDTHYGKEITISRNDLLNTDLVSLFGKNSETRLWGILSEVILATGEKRNIPLLDFHCPISETNQETVFKICNILLPGGFALIQSDRSYHCYGFCMYDSHELIDFLARALMYSPIIDRAYIAHQLLEKRCSLRISGKENKSSLPKVIGISQDGKFKK